MIPASTARHQPWLAVAGSAYGKCQAGCVWGLGKRRPGKGHLSERQNGVSTSVLQNLWENLGAAQNLTELVTELATELV